MRLIDADALKIPSEEMISKMVIDSAPTIDAVPVRHGRWKCVSIGRYACSLCGFEPWYEGNISTLNYCPNCGAKMDDYDYVEVNND